MNRLRPLALAWALLQAPGVAAQASKAKKAPKRDHLAEALDQPGDGAGGRVVSKWDAMDRAFKGLDTARARNMAGAVMYAMDGLTRQGANALDQQTQARTLLAQIAGEISALILRRDSQLAEYRLGLFCGGCGKTKSVLLAQGDEFPHPGQKIVQPTEAELRAKALELQAPIDRKEQEATKLRAKERDCRAILEELAEQLQFGLWLWQTAITFEHNRILQEGELRASQSQEEARHAESRRSQAFIASTQAKDPGARKQAEAKLREARAQVQAAVAQKAADRAWEQTTLSRAAQTRDSELARLTEFLERGRLPTRIPLLATYTPSSEQGAHHALGGNFKMGRLRSAGATFAAQEETSLASVDQFIGEFRGSAPGRTPIPRPKPTPKRR